MAERLQNMFQQEDQFDSEQSIWMRIGENLQDLFFTVIFLLLKEPETNLLGMSLLSIIELLQIQYYSFHPLFQQYWNADSISNGLYRLFGFLHIDDYFRNSPSTLQWADYIVAFYVFIGVAFLYLLLFFFIGLSYRYKWRPDTMIYVLKLATRINLSVLMMPMLKLFLSMLRCSNGAHQWYPEQTCWSGLHIFHSVMAVLVTSIFGYVSLLVSSSFYECRQSTTDCLAKANGRSTSILVAFKILAVVIFTFISTSDFMYLILAFILSFSIINFYHNSVLNPYFDDRIAQINQILAGLFLWTNVMLLIGITFQKNLIQGTIIIYIFGIPILSAFFLSSRDQRITLIADNINKFTSGEDIIMQMRFILTLIYNYNQNQKYATYLDGYIQIHKQQCNQDMCPLKLQKGKTTRIIQSILISAAATQQEFINEKMAQLIQHIYMQYLAGVQKFPNNTYLRISNAFFLLDRMKYRQAALMQIQEAEKNIPPFQERGIIFRLKKIVEQEIEDEVQKYHNESIEQSLSVKLDILSEMRWQKQFKELHALIEQSALSHMQFWSTLSDESPDMQKLSQCGQDINRLREKVIQIWQILCSIHGKRSRAISLYRKYVNDIVHDEDQEKKLHELENVIMQGRANMLKQNMMEVNLDQDTNDQFQENPTVVISAEADRIGIITNVNLTLANFLGYNKTEIINRKVNTLMSDLFAEFHDEFLENYLNTNELVSFKEGPKYVFAKHQSEYIIPISLDVKAYESLIHGHQLAGVFKHERSLKVTGYLIVHPNGKIDSMSASAVSILRIDWRRIQTKKPNIDNIFPYFMANRGRYETQTGVEIAYKLPIEEDFKKQKPTVSNNDKDKASKQKTIQANAPTTPQEELSEGGASPSNGPVKLKFLLNKSNSIDSKDNEAGLKTPKANPNQNQLSAPSKTYQQSNTNASIGTAVRREKYVKLQVQVSEIKIKTKDIVGYLVQIEEIIIQKDRNMVYQKSAMEKQIFRPYNMEFSFEGNSDKGLIFSAQNVLNTDPNNSFMQTQSEIDKQSVESLKLNQTGIGQQVKPSNFIQNQGGASQLPQITVGTQNSIDDSQIPKNQKKQKKINDWLRKKSSLDETTQMDYSKGIKIMRFHQSVMIDLSILDILEENKSDEDDDDPENSIFGNQDRDDQNDKRNQRLRQNFNEIFNDRTHLNKVILYQQEPAVIRSLNLLVKMMIFSLLIIALAQFFLVRTQFQYDYQSIKLVTLANKRSSYIQEILALSNDLYLTRIGVLDGEYTSMDSLKVDLDSTITKLDSIHSELQLSFLSTGAEYNDMFSANKVNVFISDNIYEKRSVIDITEMIISSAVGMKNIENQNLLDTSADYMFLQKNILNSYFMYLLDGTKYYTNAMISYISQDRSKFQIIFILSPIIIVLSMILMLPVLVLVNQQSKDILELFLQISTRTCQVLYLQCERFVHEIRADDENEQQSVADLNQKDEKNPTTKRGAPLIAIRRKQKFIDNMKSDNHIILLKLISAATVLQVYFIYNFISLDTYSTNLRQLSNEFNQTAFSQTYYSFANNAQRSLFINETEPIFNTDALKTNEDNIQFLFQIDSDMLQEHSKNIQIQSNQYNDVYSSIMTLDPCYIYVQEKLFANQQQCNLYKSGVLKDGLSVAETSYFETMRYLLSLYEDIKQGKDVYTQLDEVIEGQFEYKKIFRLPLGKLANDKFNLLRLNRSKFLRFMQKSVLNVSYRYLVDNFQDTLLQNITVTQDTRVIIFIIYLLLSFLIYFFIWIPLVMQLTDGIFKTRSLLTTIPLIVGVQMRKIKIYFMQLYETYENDMMVRDLSRMNDKDKKIGKFKE